jgi:hypothetical protein
MEGEREKNFKINQWTIQLTFFSRVYTRRGIGSIEQEVSINNRNQWRLFFRHKTWQSFPFLNDNFQYI